MVFESSKDMKIIDSSDPYHFDPPIFRYHVVVKILNGENYGTWSHSMTIALSSKNKIRFIDGSITRPPRTDAKFSYWKRCNGMVISWILNTTALNLANSVIYTNSVAEVWVAFKERFSQNNVPRIFQI
ncbi:hypothetical protein CK203_022496 [Vitis vinifera]|uniref:Retrotransposon Copia-like N-terminal domain-containing protein n=1 Tax=Vitis vinifera TaxID=29760 RepID=A0A438JEN9_VITVI|nr:hypothetical protein CK203_022496 [Vitis vinifera]